MVPAFPLPFSLTSKPATFLLIIIEKLILPIKYDKIVAEALIHPCRYEDGTIDNHFEEFQITRNKKLKEKIEQLGFEITNYADKEQD